MLFFIFYFHLNNDNIKGEYNAISNNLKKLNIKQILRLIELGKLSFERKNEEKDVEYETCIKTPDIFILLSLINSTILTIEKEEQIPKHFKDKFDGGIFFLFYLKNLKKLKKFKKIKKKFKKFKQFTL